MTMSRAAAPPRHSWFSMLPGALLALATALAAPAAAFASELDLKIPALDTTYSLFGNPVSGVTLLMAGLFVCILGGLFGLAMFNQVKGLPAHKSMLDVSAIIYQTCRAYL
ncbi:MAG: hypothetical protein HY076_00935, partial [Candidatus Eisenbacteria bacterium]|nr:hypothetical protein [Candidatus Eisenbacteria bacterium]